MFDFNVNFYGRMGVSVIAEDKTEAERILKETMEEIEKNIKETEKDNFKIKNSKIFMNYHDKQKERESDR